jgi:cysteinyl-tRNA synthetase
VLKVKEKDTDKNPMSFTFIDSVLRYVKEMVEGELEDAYRRAGRTFQGQLQQNFGVLRDREAYPVMANQGASTSTPRKKHRKDEARWQEQKRDANRGRGLRGKMW